MKPPPWNAGTRQCYEFAIRQLLAGDDPGRREQIEAKLRTEPRQTVGHFAVVVVQSTALGLRPWVLPPISWHEPERGHCPGDNELRQLCAMMKRLKIPLAHPDPVRAVAEAEAAADALAQAGPTHHPKPLARERMDGR